VIKQVSAKTAIRDLKVFKMLFKSARSDGRDAVVPNSLRLYGTQD
jgi:hypothetical protein